MSFSYKTWQGSIMVDVNKCARCGGNHRLLFVKLLNPEDEFTMWASCPRNYQPILLSVVNSPLELPPPTETPTP